MILGTHGILNRGSSSPQSVAVEIGTPGTLTSDSLGISPFAFAYDYSFASWIVTAAELSAAGMQAGQQINSMELYLGSLGASPYSMLTQRIYMGHTTQSSWTGDVPNVDHTDVGSTVTDRTYVKPTFTKSYSSGEVDTWILFTFDTSFVWNGVDNVCIDWENRDGSYVFSGPRFDIQTVNDSVAYKRTDSSYPTGSCFLYAERPVMKLNVT